MENCELFEDLLNKINSKLKKKKTKIELKKIQENFCKLSKYLEKINNILQKGGTNQDKIDDITNIEGINSKYEASEIVKVTEINNSDDNLKNIGQSVLSIPAILINLLLMSPRLYYRYFNKVINILPDFIYKADYANPNDYKTKMNIGYVLLFILSSVPYAGALSDFLIISNALEENRIFLAIIVSITSMLSFFSLRIFDFGSIPKLLYLLDNYSYVNYSKQNKITNSE